MLEKMLDKAVSTLASLVIIYSESDISQKREIIGSIYPEKLTFSESGYRTTRANEIGSSGKVEVK